MRLAQLFKRKVDAPLTLRRHTPWIASPLQGSEKHGVAEAPAVFASNSLSELEHGPPDKRDVHSPPFKHHREASTIELCYDLFFVANLATFTNNHEIVNDQSLKNYIGFFTLLWFTWLQTSLFDVRFASDSVFNRFCKAISFGVMTGFAITGAIYDTTDVADNVEAFRAMSLILMASRLALVAQYGVILWYVRGYKKTLAPLLGTMAALFGAAMIFLGTFFGFNVNVFETQAELEATAPHTYIAWYVTVCVEAALIIAISCVWRIVSFKRTHLVERVGLLTLIIIGEGIIGMTKSVTTIVQGTQEITGSDIGVILSSVLVIYFVWVLYFDQIEHDRFGTIRQQIWAILHYPLHVAVLLTVEGSTALVLWNAIVRILLKWNAGFPFPDGHTLVVPVNSTEELITYVEHCIEDLSAMLRHPELERSYDYEQNLTAVANLTSPFGSPLWLNQTEQILEYMWKGIQTAIFEHYGVEDGETTDDDVAANLDVKLTAIDDLWGTVFAYFYIAAGSFLIALAVMYWLGKTRKSPGEWVSILIRLVSGVGLGLFCLFSFAPDSSAQVGFVSSFWPIPAVMLVFLVVIVADNLLVWHTNKTIAKQTSHAPPALLPSQAENRADGTDKARHQETERDSVVETPQPPTGAGEPQVPPGGSGTPSAQG